MHPKTQSHPIHKQQKSQKQFGHGSRSRPGEGHLVSEGLRQERHSRVGVVKILGQHDLVVLLDVLPVELHAAGGLHEVARLLEKLLVDEVAAGDPERRVHDGDVRAALQLGLLAKLLAVRGERVVVHLGQVLGGCVGVQGGGHEAGKGDAQALETVVVVAYARSVPSLECPTWSSRRLGRQDPSQRLQTKTTISQNHITKFTTNIDFMKFNDICIRKDSKKRQQANDN